MVVNDTKIYQKMKNKSWLNTNALIKWTVSGLIIEKMFKKNIEKNVEKLQQTIFKNGKNRFSIISIKQKNSLLFITKNLFHIEKLVFSYKWKMLLKIWLVTCAKRV